MNTGPPVVAMLLLLAVILFVGGLASMLWRRRAEREVEGEEGLPPLVFPARRDDRPAEPGARPGPDETARVTDARNPEPANPPAVVDPPTGTLHLLPGRLEVMSGLEGHEEIRFVRVSGHEPEVTIGRGRGDAHRHITLRSQTVSRRHARFSFRERRWYVRNLSTTNPLVLNGQRLEEGGAEVALKDGDRIELGEVVLRFRIR